jgi:thioredoxin reductase (NADPH)
MKPLLLQRENSYVRTGREVTDQPGWVADRPPFPLETNLPGFFCVGDIRCNSIKRVSSSVGEGSMAVASLRWSDRRSNPPCSYE